jgi:DNA processing protein
MHAAQRVVPGVTAAPPTACGDCLRSSWVRGALSAHLEKNGRDYQRLMGLLELDGLELIARIGAGDREDLRSRYRAFKTGWVPDVPGVSALCRHHPGYPQMLVDLPGAPAVLYLAAPPERLATTLSQPAVAIVGERYASDYGSMVARRLARELAGEGVTVVGGFSHGIAGAALKGALDMHGRAIAVMPAGVDVCHPHARHVLYRQLLDAGCVVSELPCHLQPRRWCLPARDRIVAALAPLMVVVEMVDQYAALMLPTLALAAGRDVAAVPGRITARGSQGTHALLADGAHLVRGTQDVLDLLYGAGVRTVGGGVLPEPHLQDD